MLQRVLEPEVMDSPEEARDYNNMDHSHVNNVFVNDMTDAGFAGGDVLDLGTGTALIPIEIVKRGFECRIMAADAAVAMLERARLNLEIAGMTRVVQLSHCDAKAMPYATGMFDWVISNSIIHHIPSPIEVLREAWRVTRAGGTLFFRDLLRPQTEEELRRLVETYAGTGNEHQQQMFDDSLHAALSLEEIRSLITEFGCGPESVVATSDRHWTWIARK
ncbi:MAG: class I SAM-dependent methyltransferase [Planctomycetaceae bacterium]|nr:class I SAM-dependent methyltransferase [Planctomycetaceae bacterium]